MASILNPYISFRRETREAMAHYQEIFGGELSLTKYSEFGFSENPDDPGEADLIMHAQLDTPLGFTLMAGDAPASMPFTDGQTVNICLSGDDEDLLRGYWAGLAEGGRVDWPLETSPWGDVYGQLVDRFGVGWMVNISVPQA